MYIYICTHEYSKRKYIMLYIVHKFKPSSKIRHHPVYTTRSGDNTIFPTPTA